MTFSIKDEKLLEKYNEIQKKVRNIIKKEFVIKPVYSEKYLNYLNTEKKVYKKMNTDFCGNKILKKNSPCVCLSVRSLQQVKIIILRCF